MKKHRVLRNILIILAIFIVSVIFFSIRQNKNEDTETVASTAPTLPVASMMIGDTEANEMFAMKETLNEASTRDSVTPIPKDKTLTLVLTTYGMEIQGISYQITTPEDEKAVENGEITDIEEGQSELTANFTIQTDLKTGQEYTLRFSVDIGQDEPVYYYTRIIQAAGVEMSGYFSFVSDFTDLCLDKTKEDELSEYLDSEDTSANLTFEDLDITSSSDMVSWADLSPTLVKSGTPAILQINDTTVTIENRYIISAVDSNDETEYSLVNDYYRLRYMDDQSSVALLDFHRSATYIFDGSHDIQTDTGINLGVQDTDVNYVTNDACNLAAFELNGDLWTYDIDTGKITCVFTFRASHDDIEESMKDDRTALTEHDIKICEVTDSGDLTFVVYGYMASGSHEGETGVSVCQYSASSNTVSERIFIPLGQNPETLEKNISRLCYVTGDYLYLYLGTEVCRISLTNGSYSVVTDNIPDGGFASSESGETVAWIVPDENGDAVQARIMNLSDGTQYDVSAPSGETLRLCGFINEDLVYGLVKSDDVVTDDSGEVTVGMYQLNIQSIDGTVKKQYTPEEGVVTSVTQETDGIALQISTLSDGTYTDSATDHIENNDLPDEAVTVTTQTFDRTAQNVYLEFPDTSYTTETQLVTAELRFTDAGSETIVQWPENATPTEGYFVYDITGVTDYTKNPGTAITEADDAHGYVLTADQSTFWVRADWDDSYKIDLTTIPDAVLNMSTFDSSALQEAVGDGYTVLDLTGTTQENWFWFVNRGYPVIAVGDNNEVYVIAGYDEYNVWAYDTSTKELYAIASDDSRSMFEENGNKFLTYVANS
jgi:hypothetical protein